MTSFLIGTYPPDGLGTPPGHGEGLWRGVVDSTGVVTAEQISVLDAPSFVAAHPSGHVAYAISETNPTMVTVWDAAGHRVGSVATGGDSGCHATVIADGSALVVAHYGSGDISVIRLDADGLPIDTEPTQQFSHNGSGPRVDRQEAPHAHFVGLSPTGEHLLVVDLGTDTIWKYRIGADGLLTPEGAAATLPPGAGPRHFAVRSDLIYVVCELDHQMRTLRWDRATATAEVIAESPTTLAPQRTADAVYDAHVDIVPGHSGDVLLVSVRGVDVVSIFDLSPEGHAQYRAAFDVGYWPRHFAPVRTADGLEYLVVTAEKGHEIRSYSMNDILALPAETEVGAIAQLPFHAVDVTSPACIRPFGS